MINSDPEGYFLEQNAYSSQIEKIPEDCDFYLVSATRHRLAWITQTRPEILAGIDILSQIKTYIQQGRHENYKQSNKTCKKIS